MSTVNLDLYALWQRGRFVTSLSNPAVPSIPTPVAGDTWAINLFYVDDTSPLQIHRFAGATSVVRMRAQGNNHVYATGTASAEIPASVTPTVTRTQSGTSTVVEKQSVAFPTAPVGGTFRIGFTGAGSGTRGGGVSLGNLTPNTIYTGPISVNASAADVLAAILATNGYYKQNDGPHTFAELAATYGSAIRSPVVTGTPLTGFVIDFGDVFGGANWWNTSIHLLVIDDSAVQYKWGWTVSVPLTAGDFSDLFVGANGPAYLEVLLNGNLAASYQLTGDPGGGNAPAFTNGPPQNSGSIGSAYDFAYTASGFPVPTFSLTSGAIPDGLTLTSAGRLSGTPTSAGTFNGVVTATNSNGTATQAFSIVIGGSGGTPGPGGVGVLASKRNGNFNVLDQSDGAYFEDRNDEWPGLIVWHIPYVIDFDQYLASVPAVGSYEGPYGYFWKDTPIRFLADGVVEFERLRHNIPGDANRKVSVSKAYQAAQYTLTNGQTTGLGIVSWSKAINATCNYHFAIDDPGVLPVVPFIQIIPYLNGQEMTDLGTGFPRRSDYGNLYASNQAASVVDASAIDHILGRLFCRRIITG